MKYSLRIIIYFFLIFFPLKSEDLTRQLPIEKTGKKYKPENYRKTFFEKDKSFKTPVYKRNQLVQGQTIRGPAIIEQMDSTAIIFPEDSGKIDNWGNLIISTNG